MNEHEHDDLLKRLDSLLLDVPPLPEAFHAGWTGRLEDDMATKQKTPVKTTLIRILSAAAALVFIIGGTMIAQQSDNKQAMETSIAQSTARNADTAAGAVMYDAMFEEADYELTADYGVVNGAITMAETPAEQMIIRSASLTIGTQSYDEGLAALRSLCEASGGWMSSSSENTNGSGLRTSYLTLRIPADKLDSFLTGANDLGRVTYRSEYAEDVTESYRDTRARLETQQALMARLQSLVTDAASLSDLLELEAQIADTQYQIDRLQASLNTTERRVNYATVDITLREESPAANIINTEKSLIERIISAIQSGGKAFVKLMENALVFLAAALPFIAIVAVVWLTAVVIRKRIKKGGNP